MRRAAVSLIVLALVAACDPPAPAAPERNSAAPAKPVAPAAPAAAAEKAADPALAVEGEGLRLFVGANASARPLPFGTPRDAVLGALAFRGAPGTGELSECGAGPLTYAEWQDGLTLYFQEGRFAGWALDKPGITTAAGVGIGDTRAELESASSVSVSESTIGTEFVSGDLAGLFEGKGKSARITNMWAGANCIMR